MLFSSASSTNNQLGICSKKILSSFSYHVQCRLLVKLHTVFMFDLLTLRANHDQQLYLHDIQLFSVHVDLFKCEQCSLTTNYYILVVLCCCVCSIRPQRGTRTNVFFTTEYCRLRKGISCHPSSIFELHRWMLISGILELTC